MAQLAPKHVYLITKYDSAPILVITHHTTQQINKPSNQNAAIFDVLVYWYIYASLGFKGLSIYDA